MTFSISDHNGKHVPVDVFERDLFMVLGWLEYT